MVSDNICKNTFKLIMKNENGSILAIAMFSLLILSMLGTFALNTADFEITIASNQQQWEKNFNISEGGTTLEGFHIGYAGVNGLYSWYEIADPEDHDKPLYPDTLANYDPSLGSDLSLTFDITNDFSQTNADTWPRQNILALTADDLYDYAYLVTYLYPDVPPKGYDATQHASYKFRINGKRQVSIEMGGQKVGVKNPL
ncbi:MAG: pilus assembly PilX N-terminal domain-containing protein [Desulfobacula sp.]|nr:pilus assembly PilX N-terminal domain-containing protein [Desulfobacula sp.]